MTVKVVFPSDVRILLLGDGVPGHQLVRQVWMSDICQCWTIKEIYKTNQHACKHGHVQSR